MSDIDRSDLLHDFASVVLRRVEKIAEKVDAGLVPRITPNNGKRDILTILHAAIDDPREVKDFLWRATSQGTVYWWKIYRNDQHTKESLAIINAWIAEIESRRSNLP